jgi:hypothetical protein
MAADEVDEAVSIKLELDTLWIALDESVGRTRLLGVLVSVFDKSVVELVLGKGVYTAGVGVTGKVEAVLLVVVDDDKNEVIKILEICEVDLTLDDKVVELVAKLKLDVVVWFLNSTFRIR